MFGMLFIYLLWNIFTVTVEISISSEIVERKTKKEVNSDARRNRSGTII